MGDLNAMLDRLKQTRWWTILKALPFDGGPSSTRWVFLCGFAVVSVCLLSMVWVMLWVYMRSADHHVDSSLCLLIGSTIGVLVGFATNSQNLRHTLTLGQPGPSENPQPPPAT